MKFTVSIMFLIFASICLSENENNNTPRGEIGISLEKIEKSGEGLKIKLKIENLTDSMLLYYSPKSGHGWRVMNIVFIDSSGAEIFVVRNVPNSSGVRLSVLKSREVKIHTYEINLETWSVVPGFSGFGDANKVKVVFNSPKMGRQIDTGVKIWAGRIESQVVETDFLLNEVFPSEFSMPEKLDF